MTKPDVLQLLSEFQSATMSACHDLAGAGAWKAADEARRELVEAIEGQQREIERLRKALAADTPRWMCNDCGMVAESLAAIKHQTDCPGYRCAVEPEKP